MEISILSQSISVVVLGRFFPESMDPVWMVKRGILKLEDLGQGFQLNPDSLSFRTKNFEVLITRSRLQVVSFEISESDVIVSFIIKVLSCKKPEKIDAIGINGAKIFTLLKKGDLLKFCHHFAPIDALTPVSSNSIMVDITWQSWEEKQTDETPQKLISLKRVTNGGKYPSFQFSENNHYRVNDVDVAIDILRGKTGTLHQVFDDTFKELISVSYTHLTLPTNSRV